MNPILELTIKHHDTSELTPNFATELEHLHANMTVYTNVRNGAKRSVMCDDSEFKKLLNTQIDCTEYARKLCKSGLFVEQVPMTPLQFVCYYFYSFTNNFQIIDSLIDHGADVHVTYHDTCTIMMAICRHMIGFCDGGIPSSVFQKRQTCICNLIQKYDFIRDVCDAIELINYLNKFIETIIDSFRSRMLIKMTDEYIYELAISFNPFLTRLLDIIKYKLNLQHDQTV
jgi:hypothetical protein